MQLIRTREEQLQGLARWYRRDGQTACAEAIEWALNRIKQLEADRFWWAQQIDMSGEANAVMHREIDAATENGR